MEEPLGDDERETFGLEPEEAQNIRADLEDLEGMRRTFQAQGVKGVVIVCERCEENHYYEWELLVENLEHMLQTGESQMHEPAFEVREEEYIQWDYGKGYVDALADTGLEPDNRVEVTRCRARAEQVAGRCVDCLRGEADVFADRERREDVGALERACDAFMDTLVHA